MALEKITQNLSSAVSSTGKKSVAEAGKQLVRIAKRINPESAKKLQKSLDGLAITKKPLVIPSRFQNFREKVTELDFETPKTIETLKKAGFSRSQISQLNLMKGSKYTQPEIKKVNVEDPWKL